MAQRIYIIGGLLVDHDRGSLEQKLRNASGDAYDWEWLKSTAIQGWRPPQNNMNQFLWAIQQKPLKESVSPKVALLKCLNKDCRNLIFKVCKSEPILIPKEIENGNALVEWLLSPEAGIVPPAEWHAGPRATAFVCILVKLLRKKAVGKDRHGHIWVQEADILGQAPVSVPERPAVRADAVTLLELMNENILISKGGNQGKTKKEWCINTAVLPAVKKLMTDRSFQDLRAITALNAVFNYVNDTDAQDFPLHEIVTERILSICREKDRDLDRNDG